MKQKRIYRGCHKDCEGCVYHVKAEVGRQHGCNVVWDIALTGEDINYRCPLNTVVKFG